MKKLDYLIVGQGIAGSCLAYKLLEEGKSVLVIDQNLHKASAVAVGVYNTVVLKRFALIWQAEEQLKLLDQYFKGFEKLLNRTYLHELPTYRIFHDQDEINTWLKKAEREDLQSFLSTEIHQNTHSNIKAPLGYGEVLQTGRVDLENLLTDYREYLISQKQYLDEHFDFNQLEIKEDAVQYKEYLAHKIVFCEGYGIKENPYFNYLPIIGVKGEVLKIKTDSAVPKAIWKAHNFLMPLNESESFTASTYNRDDLNPEPSEAGKKEILENLEEIFDGHYEVLEHTAGIRPTVVDRRPILGTHPEHENLVVLNGMGTRGTLLAPQMTEFLVDFLENGNQIVKEADIRRFDKLYHSEK